MNKLIFLVLMIVVSGCSSHALSRALHLSISQIARRAIQLYFRSVPIADIYIEFDICGALNNRS